MKIGFPQKIKRFAGWAISSFVFLCFIFFPLNIAAKTLKWRKQPIKIAISSSLLEHANQISNNEDIMSLIKRSAEKWEAVANIKFEFFISEKRSISTDAPDGINLITIESTPDNIAFLGEDIDKTPAKTKIFYSRNNIVEADIALNPYVKFSTDGKFGTFDFETILTHEIGHLIGLEHMNLYCSIMTPQLPKNGTYGIPQIFFRDLSQADISLIRSIYGTNHENCCSSVTGRITVVGEKTFPLQVWLEDAESGRLQAFNVSNSYGSFFIGGIEAGKYRLYVQGIKNNKIVSSELGTILLKPASTIRIFRIVEPKTANLSAEKIGFNAQLSTNSIIVNPSSTYLVYLSINNNSSQEIQIESTSPNIKPIADTIIVHESEGNLSVISIGLEILESLNEGAYTLKIRDKDAEFFLIGAIVTSDKGKIPKNFFLF